MEESRKKNWFKRHKILTVIGVIVVVAIIATAASGNKANVNTTATSNSATNTPSTSQTSSSKQAATTAHVGSSVDVGGSKGLAVTLQQVIDPSSSGNQYITADAGKRFVAVKVEIVNNGTASYKDDANNNLTLIGSDNQSYTADFSGVDGCTNFSEGEYTLAPGASATGCVNYELPNGVQAAKVQFTPDSGFSGNTAEWLVP